MAQVKDPVCGMTIDKTSAGGSSFYRGKRYSFCSPACKLAFDAKPEQYADKS